MTTTLRAYQALARFEENILSMAKQRKLNIWMKQDFE